jgi:hypothetical protein
MDQRYLKTSAYFFVAVFSLFLFVDDKTLLIILIAVVGVIWIFDGIIFKQNVGKKHHMKNLKNKPHQDNS